MPLSFAVLLGSLCSMIGTSTNLVVQGLMVADRKYQFPFFAPIGIALPVGAACLLFMIVSSPYLLPNDKTGLLREVRDNTDELVAEVQIQAKSPYVGRSLLYCLGELGIPTTQHHRHGGGGAGPPGEVDVDGAHDGGAADGAPAAASPELGHAAPAP